MLRRLLNTYLRVPFILAIAMSGCGIGPLEVDQLLSNCYLRDPQLNTVFSGKLAFDTQASLELVGCGDNTLAITSIAAEDNLIVETNLRDGQISTTGLKVGDTQLIVTIDEEELTFPISVVNPTALLMDQLPESCSLVIGSSFETTLTYTDDEGPISGNKTYPPSELNSFDVIAEQVSPTTVKLTGNTLGVHTVKVSLAEQEVSVIEQTEILFELISLFGNQISPEMVLPIVVDMVDTDLRPVMAVNMPELIEITTSDETVCTAQFGFEGTDFAYLDQMTLNNLLGSPFVISVMGHTFGLCEVSLSLNGRTRAISIEVMSPGSTMRPTY